MIAPISAAAPDLLERLEDVRGTGRIPLVTDPRWSPTLREAVHDAATRAEPAAGTAWATLTSGSSGAPRIVLRTAESWSESFDAVAELLRARAHGVVALPAPASASLTLFSLAHALSGGPVPRLGTPVATDATSVHATPHGLRAMLDAGPPERLRTALIGGSHLDAALAERARATGIRVVSYYGAAELSFVAVDDGDGLRPFPGVEIDVRGGEIWVRSPYLASGYAGAPGPLRRDGAWASVGDRGELADGRLRLRGRADGALLSASATIVPEEVEQTLRSLPGVRDAVVFGLPHARLEALVAALVEAEPSISAQQLRGAAADQLTPAHRPRLWFTGEIPRTASGKPARAEAARRAQQGEVERLV